MSSLSDAFISYSRKDASFAHRLSNDLALEGVSVFSDFTGTTLGGSFPRSVELAISASKHVLVVMSPDYFESKWTRTELQLALELEAGSGEERVIPLYLRPCDIPQSLRDRGFTDFSGESSYDSSFLKLLGLLRGGECRATATAIPSCQGSSRVVSSEETRATFREADAAAAALLATPLLPNQFLCRSKTVQDAKLCFAAMPFGTEDQEVVYEDFVRPALEAHCLLKCERGRDLHDPHGSVEELRTRIELSRVVIADLTGRNHNVFYEIGIAHALGKPVLLLARSLHDVPPDLRRNRLLIYDYSPRGCKRLETALVAHVKAILALTPID